jgi:hypothetical protein
VNRHNANEVSQERKWRLLFSVAPPPDNPLRRKAFPNLERPYSVGYNFSFGEASPLGSKRGRLPCEVEHVLGWWVTIRSETCQGAKNCRRSEPASRLVALVGVSEGAGVTAFVLLSIVALWCTVPIRPSLPNRQAIVVPEASVGWPVGRTGK